MLHGEDGTGQRDKKTYTFTKSGAQMNMRSALRRGSRERAKKDRKPGQPDQRESLGTGMTSCTGALSLGRPWLLPRPPTAGRYYCDVCDASRPGSQRSEEPSASPGTSVRVERSTLDQGKKRFEVNKKMQEKQKDYGF